MAGSFRSFSISFEIETSNEISNMVANELNQYIDIELAEQSSDRGKVQFNFVSMDTIEDVAKACDLVKKTLEQAGDHRLIYQISTISL